MITIPVQFAAAYHVGLIVLLSICVACVPAVRMVADRNFRFYDLTISAEFFPDGQSYIGLPVSATRPLSRAQLHVALSYETTGSQSLTDGRAAGGSRTFFQFLEPAHADHSYEKQGVCLASYNSSTRGRCARWVSLGIGTVRPCASGDVYRFYGSSAWFGSLRAKCFLHSCTTPSRVEITRVMHV